MSHDLPTTLSYWPAGAMFVGGVLAVAARFHKYLLRPGSSDPGEERRLYWVFWSIGGVLLTAAMIPNGWKAALAVGFFSAFVAILEGPWVRWNRRHWEWSDKQLRRIQRSGDA